ncbi:hypothetical protein FOZ62_004233 [Perkinsus olseni]|uniref:Uncharacterized protein n=1 Tax=Perkinsus olseni TaxID=32597 RepID=A0A7J6QT27_PEROL|nr:hypothetical protein FOZ62_004233 [Perkinsus olseni]
MYINFISVVLLARLSDNLEPKTPPSAPGHSDGPAQPDAAPASESSLGSAGAGNNYEKPLNDCPVDAGCDCNTTSAIVTYDSGKAYFAVCADDCETANECPPYHAGKSIYTEVKCVPLGRCYINCMIDDDCPGDALCKEAHLAKYVENVCLYYVR